jgi:hypothetical protein
MYRMTMAAMATTGALALFACTSPAPEPQPRTLPSSSFALKTIKVLDVGDQIALTARVRSAPDTKAMIVGDVDLPRAGLLVLGSWAGPLHSSDLVMVTGAVATFSFKRFAGTYGLSRESAYVPFENQKFVLAEKVQSFA